MKGYYYVFYRLYAGTRLVGWSRVPHLAATLQITFVDFFVAFTVMYWVAPHWAYQTFTGHFSQALILMAGLYLLNYLIFIPNHRYQKVNKTFEKETHRTQVVGGVLTAVFVVVLIYITFTVQAAAGH